jgi:hypothetical protein
MYRHGYWIHDKKSLIPDPGWSGRSWAFVKIGTVRDSTNPFPSTHPWGIPEYATHVEWDDEDGHGSFDWVRTSCLDVIGFESREERKQTEFALNI